MKRTRLCMDVRYIGAETPLNCSEHKQVEQLAYSSSILAVCNPTVTTYLFDCVHMQACSSTERFIWKPGAIVPGHSTNKKKPLQNCKPQTSCKHRSESTSIIIGLLAQCENILENKWTSHFLPFPSNVSAFAQAKDSTRFCLTLTWFWGSQLEDSINNHLLPI